MKIRFILYIFLFAFFLNKNLLADEIFFDSKNLKIENEGNMIFATEGIAKIPSKNTEIQGDKFIYNKLVSELTIIDNVKYFDNKKNIYIESEKLIFNQINNTIYSKGKTFIKLEEKYEVHSEDILYDRNLMKISSKKYTLVNDFNKNKFRFENGFLFNTIEEIISSKNTSIIDIENNYYSFENSKVNLKTNEILGKEVKVDFEDSFFGNEKNDPILKGKSTVYTTYRYYLYINRYGDIVGGMWHPKNKERPDFFWRASSPGYSEYMRHLSHFEGKSFDQMGQMDSKGRKRSRKRKIIN